MGYLMGVPVGSYSLDLGRAHTDFIETKLQRCARRAAPCSQLLVALVSRGRLSCSLSANGHRGPACILYSVGMAVADLPFGVPSHAWGICACLLGV